MKTEKKIPQSKSNQQRENDPVLFVILLLIIGFTIYLTVTLLKIPLGQNILIEKVNNNLLQSGVNSQITSVLLSFRSYDTLLEMFALLLSAIGIWSCTKAPIPTPTIEISPIHISVLRLLSPLMCITAAYLVWQGGHAAGGAFQSGAVLGGSVVLLLITDLPGLRTLPALPLRIILITGPATFLTIGLLCLKDGLFLQYPQNLISPLILTIEITCALSIGITIGCLFAGGRPRKSIKNIKNEKK